MVDAQVVQETVKRMLGSGIDTETIRQTLADIGLSEAEIQRALSQAGAPAAGSPRVGAEEPSPEKVRDALLEDTEDEELRETTTHAALEEHGLKLDELHDKVDALHEKIGSPSLSAQAFDARLNQFEKDLGEIKAANKALQDLLKKILEANRDILIRLEQKK